MSNTPPLKASDVKAIVTQTLGGLPAEVRTPRTPVFVHDPSQSQTYRRYSLVENTDNYAIFKQPPITFKF